MAKAEKFFFYDEGGYKSKYLQERLKGTYINGEKVKILSPSTVKDYKRKFKQIGVYESLISKDIGEFSPDEWYIALKFLYDNGSSIFANNDMINGHFTVFQQYILWYSGEKINLYEIMHNLEIEDTSPQYDINSVISRKELYSLLSKSNSNSLRGGIAFLLAFEGLYAKEIMSLDENKDIDVTNNCLYVNRFGKPTPLFIPTETMDWIVKLKREFIEVDRGNSKNSKAAVNFNSSFLIKDSRNNTNEPVKDVTFYAMVDNFIKENHIPVKNRLVDARYYGAIDNLLRLDSYFDDFDIYNNSDVYMGVVFKFGRKSENTKERYKRLYLEYIGSMDTNKYGYIKHEVQGEDITKQIVENINQNFIGKEGLVELKKVKEWIFDDGNIDIDTDSEYSYDIDEDTFGEEGKKKLIIHYKKERRSGFIKKCKLYFKQKHGCLYCEVCGDILVSKYGEIANDYIEAHHKTPLKDLTKETKIYIKDIAMVCPNCHGLIHSRNPCYTVIELQEIIKL
jgi:predicted HNH restriction endonuclease